MIPLSNIVAARYLEGKYKSKTEDEEGNTHYEYGPRQVQQRHEEKAERLDKLQSSISDLRAKVKKDLQSKDDETRLTALAIALINETYERVGNTSSAEDGHYGVTCLEKRHVSFEGGKARLKYTGKSGVKHDKTVENEYVVKALEEAVKDKQSEDSILAFQGEGIEKKIDGKEVNEYLDQYDVTAKDLRGFHANREMQDALKAVRKDGPELPVDRKERDAILKDEFKKVLEEVSKTVGHTSSMLKDQYLVPGLEDAYMKDGTVIEDMSVKKAALDREAGLLRWLRGLLSKSTIVKAVFDWGVEEMKGSPVGFRSFDPKGYVYLFGHGWYSTLGEGFSIEKHTSERAAIHAVRWEATRVATKAPSEKEDEAIEDMSQPNPKKKPPRYDLRKRRLDVDDPDIETQGQEGDRDLSLNYKRIAAKKPKALFTAVILDDPSALFRWWEKETGIPLLSKRFAHHMTIKFKPSPEEVKALPMGDSAPLEIVGWAADEKCQTVKVKVAGVTSSNKIAHITVATDGTSPVYSNDLLAKGVTPAKGKKKLKARVGFVSNKQQDTFDLKDTIYEESLDRVASRYLEAVERKPGDLWETKEKGGKPFKAKHKSLMDKDGLPLQQKFKTKEDAEAWLAGDDPGTDEDEGKDEGKDEGEGSETPKEESPEDKTKRIEKAVEALEATIADAFDVEMGDGSEDLQETEEELGSLYQERAELLAEMEDLEGGLFRAGETQKARDESRIKKLKADADKITKTVNRLEGQMASASPMWETKKSIADAMALLDQDQQLELSESVQGHINKAIDVMAVGGKTPDWVLDKSRASRSGVDTEPFEKLSAAQSQVKESERNLKDLGEQLKALESGEGSPEEKEEQKAKLEEQVQGVEGSLGAAKARLAKAEKRVSVEELAESIAYSQIAQQVTFNPMWSGGSKIKNDADQATPEKLGERANIAVVQFGSMKEKEQEEILHKLNDRISSLTNVDGTLKDEKRSAEYKQVKAVRNSLATARLLNDQPDSFGNTGDAPSAGVLQMIKSLQSQGKMGDVLKIADDPGSDESKRIYDEALADMSPTDIVAVTGGDKSPYGDMAKALDSKSSSMTGDGRAFLEDWMRRNASHDFSTKGPMLAKALSGKGKEDERKKKQKKEQKDKKKWADLSPSEKRDQIDDAVARVHSSTAVVEAFASIGKLKTPPEGTDEEVQKAVSQHTEAVHKALADEHSKLSGGKEVPESFRQALAKLVEDGTLEPEQVRRILEQAKEASLTRAVSLANKSSQSFLYNLGDISRGLPVSEGPLRDRDEQSGPTRFRRHKKMATLTPHGAKQVSQTLDRIATLFETEARALGVPTHVATDFSYRCDLLSDHVERQAGADRTALDELDVVKEEGFDPDDIGREVAGPAEGDGDEGAYMDGHFTQQSNRELRGEQEEGDLASASTESRGAEPGKQASRVVQLAKQAHDEQVMELGRLRDHLKLCAAKLAAAGVEGVGGISSAADTLVSTVDKIRDSLISAGAAGEDGLSLESLAASDRVVGAVSEVVPYLQGLCDSMTGAGDSSPTAQLRLEEMISGSAERMEKLVSLADDIVNDAASSIGKKAAVQHGFDLTA